MLLLVVPVMVADNFFSSTLSGEAGRGKTQELQDNVLT